MLAHTAAHGDLPTGRRDFCQPALLLAQEFLTPIGHSICECHRYVSLGIRNYSVFDRPDNPRRTVRCFVGVAASHPVISNLVIRWEITCCERSTEVLFSGERELLCAENQPQSRIKTLLERIRCPDDIPFLVSITHDLCGGQQRGLAIRRTP